MNMLKKKLMMTSNMVRQVFLEDLQKVKQITKAALRLRQLL